MSPVAASAACADTFAQTIIPMKSSIPSCVSMIFILASCGDAGNNTASAQTAARSGASFIEGKDYTILERVRFLDEQGFQQPAEAFSVLLPKGWKHSGGIQWNDMDGCRGELVTASWTASSSDGAIRFTALPLRTWGSASDPMMQQSMMMQ